ncbi:lipoprotein [Emticicia oligotrophica DSM 17448]|jgi:hypothetical protein|uniref:Lipoprotein n=1 Tax=Emticicia oligotrophica (strain DSM 17448 / CIP 109782 / MTCC 6937 / GPTSA100-15) TaxID=929562 RepID=A0ABM5N162_EMTOG|nr:hypothetical protein [Emticicia oligotrophica]AFK03168.1 lipoprotein [Emticicia oligotrophica DSM 17448]
MNKWVSYSCIALASVLTLACDKAEVSNQVSVFSSFENGFEGWIVDLAEYNTSMDSSSIEFKYGVEKIPSDSTKKGLRVQSHNRSDDMFMYAKKKISGLNSQKTYEVFFNIELGTYFHANSVGIGGSPGSSVYVKAGASSKEPNKYLEGDFYKFNLDKGNQAEGGKELITIGDASNGLSEPGFKVVNRNNTGKLVTVKPNEKGEIWLCVGTDSGFEGLSVLYYDKISVYIKEKATL